jgi:hypothetical protein
MFQKVFVLTMILIFTVVQVNAATHNNLKTAFDQLNYSLTVEWDQTDRAFYQQQMENFAHEIKALQAEGLSNQELLDFTLAQIKDDRLARDLRTAFTMVIVNKMSSEEAHRYVTDIMNQSYSQGASWVGEAVGGVLIVVVFVALAAMMAGKAKIEDGCYKVRTCSKDCYGGVCYEECNFRCI